MEASFNGGFNNPWTTEHVYYSLCTIYNRCKKSTKKVNSFSNTQGSSPESFSLFFFFFCYSLVVILFFTFITTLAQRGEQMIKTKHDL